MQGFVFNASTNPLWHTLRIRASESSLLAPAYLEDMKRTMPHELYEMEFEANFIDESTGKRWLLAYTTADKSMVHKENERPWGLKRAFPEFDNRTGESVVGFEFEPQGAALFGELSGHLEQFIVRLLAPHLRLVEKFD